MWFIIYWIGWGLLSHYMSELLVMYGNTINFVFWCLDFILSVNSQESPSFLSLFLSIHNGNIYKIFSELLIFFSAHKTWSVIFCDTGGMMSLAVESKTKDLVKCVVVDGGELKSRRHLNMRGKSATLPSITGLMCFNFLL